MHSALFVLSFLIHGAPERLLDAAPFTADLAAVAGDMPGPAEDVAPVDILLWHLTRTLESDGRSHLKMHVIYRVRTAGDAGSWQSLRWGYSPSYEAKPVLKARVLGPDGRVFTLSDRALTESAAQNMNGEVYGDGKVIGGPLPAIQRGAIVETLVEVKQTRAFFAPGVVYNDWDVFDAPMLVQQLDVDVADGVTFTQKSANLPGLKTQKRASNGRTLYTYRVTNAPRLDMKTLEAAMPTEIPMVGYVAYSTGASWSALAAAYDKRVQAVIAQSDRTKLAPIVIEAKQKAGKDPRALVRALTRSLQQQVRYTGVELGAQAIEPARPDETLARQYGDCKDGATLLVALLREAGITAHVALLRAATMTRDVQPELPGLGMFNHAIAYVPSLDMWIDTTTDAVQAGDLPSADRTRYALVAAPTTKSLVKTPSRSAADNVEIETITMVLPETGNAEITNSLESRGVHGERERAAALTRTEQGGKDWLKKVCDNWEAEPVAITATDPRDFTKPFKVDMRCKGSTFAKSFDLDAYALLGPQRVLGALGDEWRTQLEEGEQRRPRKQDYVILEPMRAETRYRIVAASGYEVEEPPASTKQTLGAFTLRREVSASENVVHVTYVVEQPKARLTAQEYDATLRALASYREKERRLDIKLKHVGEQLRTEGKLKEALAEFRRLDRLHPTEGRHLAQEAIALAEVGLASDARERIETALARDPSSAYVQRTAGWIYLRDSLGRFATGDWDRARAVKHLRRAKALDYSDDLARVLLLEGLERNDAGDVLGEGVAVNDVITESKELETDFPDAWDAQKRLSLVAALFVAKRYPEVLAQIGNDPQEDLLSYAFATELITKGVDKGLVTIGERGRKNPQATMGAVGKAALLLLNHRHYAEARVLMDRLVQLAPAAEPELRPMMVVLKNLQPFDPKRLANDPEPIAKTKRLLYDLFVGAKDAETKKRIAALFPDEADDAKQAFEIFARAFKQMLASSGLSARPAADMVVNMKYALEGSEQLGFKVTVGDGTPNGKASWLVFVKEQGKLRLLGGQTGLGPLGEEALRRLTAGDVGGAQTLLTWAKSASPLLSWLPAQADKRQLALAASLLTVELRPAAAPMLAKLCAKTSGEKEQIMCSLSLARSAALAKRYAEAKQHIEAYLKLRPDDAFMKSRLVQTRAELGELEGDPSAEAQFEAAMVKARAGELAIAEKRLLALHGAGTMTAEMYNELAWIQLVIREPGEDTLNFARRAAEAKGARASAWHTLATVQASRGTVRDARESLFKSMDMRMRAAPDADDHYVLGRIAESLGLFETAATHYAKASGGKSNDALATAKLVAKRMQVLEKPAAAKTAVTVKKR